MIVSASRRTDIPSYYSEWMANRIKAGFAMTRNPLNPRQVRRVELLPETVECIVLWTKEPAPAYAMLDLLDARGFMYYFQFTLTPYGRGIEPGLRDKAELLREFQRLSRRLGRERVIWRYDPIMFGGEMTPEWHAEHFARMCAGLEGYTDTVYISFADQYRHLPRGLIGEISEETMRYTASLLAPSAREHGMRMRACCERADLSEYGIEPGRCVDGELAARLGGRTVDMRRDTAQREGCHCVRSVDIGAYDTCPRGCVYCYACRSERTLDRNIALCDPRGEFLLGGADGSI